MELVEKTRLNHAHFYQECTKTRINEKGQQMIDGANNARREKVKFSGKLYIYPLRLSCI